MPMALLSRRFQCIAYSQPQGGLDRARLQGYRHDTLVEDLLRFLDQIGIRPAVVAGHSYGSTIVLRAMHREPERFARGVSIMGFAHFKLPTVSRYLLRMLRHVPGRVSGLPFRRSTLRDRHYEPFASREPEVWNHFVKHTGEMPLRSFAHWALELHDTDIRGMLGAIRQPVLVLAGEKDRLVPRHHQEMLFRQLTSPIFHELAGSGHFPNWTHPEALAQAIERFHDLPACQTGGNHALCTTQLGQPCANSCDHEHEHESENGHPC
jgi:3-oxoadipate enol-lactonase